MVGLDAAGKTTILYKLKLGEIVTTIPTIGMSFLPRRLSRSREMSVIVPRRYSDVHDAMERHVVHSQITLTSRFQCRDGRVQEYLIHRMGCRRTRQNQASMETLLVISHPS